MSGALIVVPCFNEARRLRVDAFRDCCARSDVDFLFVDDGSTDETGALLHELERSLPRRVSVLALGRNRGKAEAVRQGMSAAFKSGAAIVGYWDADLATPLDEIARLREVLVTHSGVDLVMGARVQLLGRLVRRSPIRHYLGRVFATATAEATQWINDQLGVAAFLDVGNAADRVSDLRAAFGVGVGARLRTPLGPLSDDESRVLAERLAPALAGKVDVDRVAREAGGHPMFLAEILRHLDSLGGDAATATLDAALTSRVDLLRADARGLLELVCIAGAPISLEVASAFWRPS